MKRNAPQNCVCGHCKAIHRPTPNRLRVGRRRNSKSLCNFGDCKCSNYRPVRSPEPAAAAGS